MKKQVFFIVALAFITCASYSQNFDFGFGVAAGTKMKIEETGTKTGFGVNARGTFSFANKFGISGGATYFLPSKFDHAGTEFKSSFLLLNADFLFYFLNIPKIKFYGLGGITNNMAMTKIGDEKDTQSNFGFEFGSGLKTGPLFIEGKYETKAKQFIATIGIYLK